MNEELLAASGNSNHVLKGTCTQVEPFLRASFISEMYHANLFFSYAYVKFLRNFAWCIGAWGTLRLIVVLQSKILEMGCQILSTASLQRLGMAILSSANSSVRTKVYTVLEYFSDLMSSFISHQQVGAIGLPIFAHSCSLGDSYNFEYSPFSKEEALLIDIAREFWNLNTNKRL